MERIIPETSFTTDGLVVTINSMVNWGNYVDAVITLQNKSEQTLVIASSDILLVDAHGNSAAPRDLYQPILSHYGLEHGAARSRREQVLPTGARVTIQLQFMGEIDSERLTTIRIRDTMRGRTVEFPLPSVDEE